MTLTLPWTAAVFPSPPDFCSPLLLPVCQLEATSSSSSSFSQTNLSGHNRLPLQLCCFWNGNPSALLVLPRGWQKLATKTLLFEGFICLSLPSDCSTVALFFFFLSGCCSASFINVEVVWSWPPSWGWSHSAWLSPSILPLRRALWRPWLLAVNWVIPSPV